MANILNKFFVAVMGAPPPQVLSKFPIIQTGLTKTNSKNTFLQNQNVSFSAFGKLFQVRKTLNRNILNEISSGNVIKLFDDISVTQKLDEVKHFAATKSQQQFWEINYFASKFCQNY